MSVRLKLEDSSEGLLATLSERSDAGKVTGRPSIFRVDTKEEAKQTAKALARTLGLKTYGIVDKTSTAGLSLLTKTKPVTSDAKPSDPTSG